VASEGPTEQFCVAMKSWTLDTNHWPPNTGHCLLLPYN
jgi:hypothetical protein